MSRIAIYAHGAARFKNSVGKVLINETGIENLNKINGDGNLAEHKVTKYADTLKYSLWIEV